MDSLSHARQGAKGNAPRIDARPRLAHNRSMIETFGAPSEPPWRAGLRGARANLLPGLVIWAITLTLVTSYLFSAGLRELLEAYTGLRRAHPFLTASVSTMIFAALIPAAYHFVRRKAPEPGVGRRLAWLTVFWAYKGLEIEVWFQLLAWLVGTDNSWDTVLIKTTLDQFVFCPFLAIPVTWAAYAWPETGFNARTVLARITAPRWYFREVLPILIANFGVWAPAIALVYLLPTPLQLPVQNLILCFFTLMLAHMAREQARPSADRAKLAGTSSST